MRKDIEIVGAGAGRGIDSSAVPGATRRNELERLDREHEAVAINITNDGGAAHGGGQSTHLKEGFDAIEISENLTVAYVRPGNGWADCGGGGNLAPGFVRIGDAALHVLRGLLHALEDGAADQFGDLRDYGVSEPFKSVCSIGNPISHSTHVGFSPPRLPELTPSTMPTDRGSEDCCRPGALLIPALKSPALGVGHIVTQRFRLTDLFVSKFNASLDVHRRSMWSDAAGVGTECVGLKVSDDPDAVASVMCANVGSWYAVPLRIIPDRGQVSENSAHSSTKQRCDVLHDDEARSKLASKAHDFTPESRAFSSEPCSKSRKGQVLAGEASADDIDGNSVSSQNIGAEFSNVMVARHLRPVFRQHAAGKFFDLAKGDRLETASAFEAKRESANAAEEVENAQLLHSPLHQMNSAHHSKPACEGEEGDKGEGADHAARAFAGR